MKKSHTRTVKLKFLSDFFQKLFNQLKGKLSATDVKRLIVINIPYFFIFVIANRISCLYQISPGMTVSDKMMYLMTHSDKVLGLVPSTDIIDILIGAGTAVATKLLMWQKQQDAKKLRKGVEYGSARWGDRDDIKPYMSDNPWMNIPLTATESITMESRPKNPKFARNKNILVIGGSGSGKTRFFVKPSVMQMNCSYVVTDPKGTLIGEVGRLLKRGAPKRNANGNVIKGTDGKPIYQPYVIKVLNTINFSKSLHYNPFAYIKSEKDILKLVTVIMANTKGEGEKENQDFWYKAERLLYTALIAYIWYEGSEEEKNFSTLLDLLNESEVREDDEEYQNPVDLLFEELEEKEPEHFAVRQYRKYKLAAGKTLKSILISCNVRLAPIATDGVRELLTYDEMEIDTLGDPDAKVAIFGILSDTDKTLSFLFAILMWQTIDQLCRKALSDYGGKLPTPVHFIFDEFANIGTIPQIEETIAVTRSRNIGITIILQSMSQLESKYDKKAQTIIDCCDSTLFLGGKSNSTNKEIAEMIGKQTIHQMTYNESTGQSSSASKNLQIQGRDLIDAAEIGKMSRLKAILLIAGTNPLMDDKYDPHAHKRYRYIVDKRNWKRLHKNSFDFERYLKNGCEPYTPDEDMGAEFTAWKWAAWKKSRKGLLGKLLNR